MRESILKIVALEHFVSCMLSSLSWYYWYFSHTIGHWDKPRWSQYSRPSLIRIAWDLESFRLVKSTAATSVIVYLHLISTLLLVSWRLYLWCMFREHTTLASKRCFSTSLPTWPLHPNLIIDQLSRFRSNGIPISEGLLYKGYAVSTNHSYNYISDGGCVFFIVHLSSLSEQCQKWRKTLNLVQQARAKERQDLEKAVSAKVSAAYHR
jgi:hypothetical protein